MSRLTSLSFFLAFLSLPTLAQDSIHPGLTADPLILALQRDYYPGTSYDYDDARDTLFKRIYLVDDSLRGVYTGFTIYLDPDADPSTDAFQKGISTEHTFPQSRGADEVPARSDMHHLFPVKDNVNSLRSSHPYDEIPDSETDTWYWLDTSQSTIPASNRDEWSEKDNDHDHYVFDGRFEPREDHKGNAARAVFYFMTMYRDRASAAFFSTQKDLLLNWHYLDPPDSAEVVRTHLIAEHQGNVNPFILDTTLVRRAWFESGSVATVSASYTFDGTTDCDNEDAAPRFAIDIASISATDFFRTGVECNQGAEVFNSVGWPTGSAIDPDTYVGFRIQKSTPPPHGHIAFGEGDSIRFQVRRSGLGPKLGSVAVQFAGEDPMVLSNWELTDTDVHQMVVDLPDTNVIGPVDFLFYGWDSELSSNNQNVGTLRFDNVYMQFRWKSSTRAYQRHAREPFKLLPPYPNPFNVSTTLSVHVDRPQLLNLYIYDIMGRRVRVAHQGFLGRGLHTFDIDAVRLASGVYHVVLAGQDGSRQRSLVRAR